MKKIMVMFMDYTGMPRAWAIGPASDPVAVEAHARRQLEAYCAKQTDLGEPALANPADYTIKMEAVE